MNIQESGSIVKDFFNVMSSNFLILISGIATGFILPAILGTTNYGYYKLFTMYASYTALLHFGFVDGILLVHGGKKYNELNKTKFRTNSKFFIIFQLIIALIFFITSLFMNNYINKILLISLGFNSLFMNIITYYQFISQATFKFSELSIVKILQSLLTTFFIILLWILCKFNVIKNVNFSLYILIILFIYFIIVLWYSYKYRDITFGLSISIIKSRKNLLNYFKTGFYLTISYQISTLILNLDSQMVSFFFNAKTFGIYSFAYSLISIILTILNAISTVLLPYMQRKSLKYILSMYPTIITYVVIIVYFFLLGYFPLNIIIKWLLPEYINSLSYFRILLPGVGINCCITLVIFNYYNVLKKSKFYFYINLIVLGLSAILGFMFYFIFKSAITIAFSSLISLLLWYLISEGILIKIYRIKWKKNIIYILTMMIVFLLITLINNIIFSGIMYLVLYLIITVTLFMNEIKQIINIGINFVRRRN